WGRLSSDGNNFSRTDDEIRWTSLCRAGFFLCRNAPTGAPGWLDQIRSQEFSIRSSGYLVGSSVTHTCYCELFASPARTEESVDVDFDAPNENSYDYCRGAGPDVKKTARFGADDGGVASGAWRINRSRAREGRSRG